MKTWTKTISSLILACSSLLFIPAVGLACSETPTTSYIVKEDPLGRIVVLWRDESDGGAIKVSIDEGKAHTISLPGQHCISPLMDFTKQGDIVVIWAGKIPDSELYSFYGAKLPYKKKWTEAEMLPEEDDLVTLTTHKLLITDADEVHVFWESFTFFPSGDNSLGHIKEIKHLKGSINHWGHKKSHALLRHCP